MQVISSGARGYGLIIAVFQLFACAGERSETTYEDVVLQLPNRVKLTTSVIENRCFSPGSQQDSSEWVDVRQSGNDVIFELFGASDDGIPLELRGRVCADEIGQFKLRLVGESQLRLPQDEGFCRTALSAPLGFGSCGTFDNLCEDQTAITLIWNACRGTFDGRFNVGLTFSEVCRSVEPCTVELAMSLAVNSDGVHDCESPLEMGISPCGKDGNCVCDGTQ